MSHFIPGEIQCEECGWRPEDPWDEWPNDFKNLGGDRWTCTTCHDCSEYLSGCRGCEDGKRESALDAGIPLAVYEGRANLSEYYSKEYIESQCGRREKGMGA